MIFRTTLRNILVSVFRNICDVIGILSMVHDDVDLPGFATTSRKMGGSLPCLGVYKLKPVSILTL